MLLYAQTLIKNYMVITLSLQKIDPRGFNGILRIRVVDCLLTYMYMHKILV